MAAQGNAGVNELRALVTDEAGRNRAAWWPRSSGTRASYIPALASSSPTCRARPSGSSPLQQARDVRAMDQARQGSDQVDAAVMLLVRRQRCASRRLVSRATACVRWRARGDLPESLQPAEGIVPRDQTLVACQRRSSLQLQALAYNLANFMRTVVPRSAAESRRGRD